MGSPLGPIFANIFMSSLEETFIDDCPLLFRPLFYKRYVDDTVALFHDRGSATRFLEFINGIHPNINFTIEHEENNKLPFLDVLISRVNNGFSTSVFRKSTFTGLGSNFYSSCFYNFKLNSIFTLLHRCYSVSSNWINFHEEIQFLNQYFLNNCFPPGLFLKHVKKFLDNLYHPKTQVPSVPRLKMFASIPFTTNNNTLKKEIENTIKKFIPGLDLRLIPKNPLSLGSLFKFKDKLSPLMQSLVIYKYTCPRCNRGTYIGSTKRLLKVRIDSHRGVSHRTGYTLSKKEFSNIRDHSIKCKTNIIYDDFKIISQTVNESSLPVLESLFIKKLVPTLNSQSSSSPLHIA